MILFNIWFRRMALVVFVFMVGLFSYLSGASAEGLCPNQKDHSLSASRYQMFAAFQTAFDGYRAPCEFKCFSKENCVQKCQLEKGASSLKNFYAELLEKKNLKSCASLAKICLETCQPESTICKKACGS